MCVFACVCVFVIVIVAQQHLSAHYSACINPGWCLGPALTLTTFPSDQINESHTRVKTPFWPKITNTKKFLFTLRGPCCHDEMTIISFVACWQEMIKFGLHTSSESIANSFHRTLALYSHVRMSVCMSQTQHPSEGEEKITLKEKESCNLSHQHSSIMTNLLFLVF